MKIIADENIPGLQTFFGSDVQICRANGRSIDRSSLGSADALLVRSVTAVSESLLMHTPVKFVGTATIGIDHMNTDWLDTRGISWASAPGSNANAAAQYALAMILLAARRENIAWADLTVGIVGCGQVGGRLLKLLRALEIPVVANDPPLAEAGVPGLVSLTEALQQRVLSLHVPLTFTGNYPTAGMINGDTLHTLPHDTLIVNAARGGVVDGDDLRAALESSGDLARLSAALDVWPTEPDIDSRLLELSTVATPHVAGYSLEGKLRGAYMIAKACCTHFGLPEPQFTLPDPAAIELPADNGKGAGIEETLTRLIIAATGVERDDSALRQLSHLPVDQRAQEFDSLRRHYPERREFGGICVATDDPELSRGLTSLGFIMSS